MKNEYYFPSALVDYLMVKAKLDKYKNCENAPNIDFYFNENNPFYKPNSSIGNNNPLD